jgi:hypothetical protein
MNNNNEHPDPMHLFGVWAEQNGYDLEDFAQMEAAIASYALSGTQAELSFEETDSLPQEKK